ncbi:hypothetical protein [Nonomuraea sp. NPDC005650]|uniref:hypothetical protein n=1 Tax=Nonomuraea sp. NPDC005650 TaxID=3157045 RepID=UPI0033A8C3AC
MRNRVWGALVAILLPIQWLATPAAAQPKAAARRTPIDVTWTGDSIETTRDQARAARSRQKSLPAALKEAQDTFIKDTAAEGRRYDAADLDVFEMTVPAQRTEDGIQRSVIATVPKGYDLERVRLVEDGPAVLAVAEGAPADAVSGNGVGTTATWNPNDGGDFLLTIKRGNEWLGKLHSMWQSQSVEDDSKSADWHGYTNKGVATPNENLSGTSDFEIGNARLESTAYDEETASHPVYVGGQWQDYSPAIDFEGDCDTTEYTATASIGAVGLEIPIKFVDCDEYTVKVDTDRPSDYSIEVDQGSWLKDGAYELGFALGLKTNANVTLKWWQYAWLQLVDQASGEVFECGTGGTYICEVENQERNRARPDRSPQG